MFVHTDPSGDIYRAKEPDVTITERKKTIILTCMSVKTHYVGDYVRDNGTV